MMRLCMNLFVAPWAKVVSKRGKNVFMKIVISGNRYILLLYALVKVVSRIKIIFVDFSLKGVETKGCETLPLLNFPHPLSVMVLVRSEQ